MDSQHGRGCPANPKQGVGVGLRVNPEGGRGGGVRAGGREGGINPGLTRIRNQSQRDVKSALQLSKRNQKLRVVHAHERVLLLRFVDFLRYKVGKPTRPKVPCKPKARVKGALCA